MIVVSMTDCPPKLRGDLSKWLMEVNTGVYVGNVSTRVRDELWDRICEHVKNGRVTMVFTAKNEQGMSFRVHNTTWEPVDYDGITLMRRPMLHMAQTTDDMACSTSLSLAAQRQHVRKMQAARSKYPTSYVAIDLETSGLSVMNDQIIELGAIRVIDGAIDAEFERLIRFNHSLPDGIVQLTGITDELLCEQGIERADALRELLTFMGELPVISHNASFDINFLRVACKQDNLPMPRSRIIDTLDVARRTIKNLPDYKLATIAHAYNIDVPTAHRALADCRILQQVYTKLNEKR